MIVSFQNFSTPEDLSAYDGLELRVKGDGRRYKLIVRTSAEWDTVGYTTGFDTVKDQWQTVKSFLSVHHTIILFIIVIVFFLNL